MLCCGVLTAHPLWLRTRRRRLGGAVSGSNSTQAAALRLVPAKLKLTLNWCAHAPLAFQIWKTVCMHTGVHSRQLVEIFRTRSCVLEHLSRIPARRARRTASAGGEGNLKKKVFFLPHLNPSWSIRCAVLGTPVSAAVDFKVGHTRSLGSLPLFRAKLSANSVDSHSTERVRASEGQQGSAPALHPFQFEFSVCSGLSLSWARSS